MSPAALAHKYFSNRILHGTLANLPADASSGFGPGCQYINTETGDTYVNYGTAVGSTTLGGGALFRCPGVNWFSLTTNFPQRPGVLGDRVVPAANTYNTAQAQLVADKSPDWQIVGTNAVDGDVVFATGGGLTVSSHGAATDSTIITPNLNTTLTAWAAAAWNTDRELRYQVRLETDTLIADETIWAGFKLTNTATITTDNDQTFFRFKDDAGTPAGNWQTTDSNNNTDDTLTATSPVGVVAISTAYVLTIQVDTLRIPRYYVNGVLKNTGLALKANTTLIPYVGILSDTSATAKTINVRQITCAQSYA